jgi:hypothetical protein
VCGENTRKRGSLAGLLDILEEAGRVHDAGEFAPQYAHDLGDRPVSDSGKFERCYVITLARA